MKLRVCDAVAHGVAPCAFNSLRHNFNPDYARNAPSHTKRDGTRARIGVHGDVAFARLSEINRALVKPLGLRGVDLKKRKRRNFKRETKQLLKDHVLAVELPAGFAQNNVGAAFIDAYVQRAKAGRLLIKQRYQKRNVGQLVLRGYKKHHQSASA